MNVYHRTLLKANLILATKVLSAGSDFTVTLELGGLGSLQVVDAQTGVRLIAPAYSIGNLLADTGTIPDRAKYLVQDDQGTRFDTARYLADYESKRPGALRMRDELVTLKPGKNGRWKATVANNLYPGVYHITAYVEGAIDLSGKPPKERCCNETPQKFTRVLNAEVGLGILPDRAKSTVAAKWVKPALRFEATVRDAFGNLPDPTTAPPPVVLINGVPVAAKVTNNYTGTYVLEVTVEWSGFNIGDEWKVGAKPGWVRSINGKRVDLPADKKLKLAVRLAGQDLSV